MIPRTEQQRGFVLIVTLWVLVMLGVMVSNLSYQVRVEAAVERWAMNKSRLRWAARGAVHSAAAQVREHFKDEYHSPIDEWWSSEELYRDQAIGETMVSMLRPNGENGPAFGLDDEESRLNINVARPEHLMGFPGVSSVVAEAIVLFRLEREDEEKEATDNDEEKARGKLEADVDSEGESEPQLITGPIRSLRELLAVEEVTEELLFGDHEERPPLANLLTTLSSGKININSASEPVLRAIGFGEETVVTMMERRKEAPYHSVDEVIQMLDPNQNSANRERLQRLLAVRSNTFRLNARATLPQKARARNVEALLGGSGTALTFIRWREH